MDFLTLAAKHEIIRNFETKCEMFSHGRCKICRSVSINLKILPRKLMCAKCNSMTPEKRDLFVSKALPVWIDGEGNTRYDIPPELKDLSIAEQTLIQRVSPFVPLAHMKNGTMGLQGHTCAFEQNIQGFINVLPRKRSDVTVMKVLRTLRDEIGSSKTITKPFRVRKLKVFKALEFLVKFNKEYSDIIIDKTALDWLPADESILPGIVFTDDDLVTHDDDNIYDDDVGPAPLQALAPRQGVSELESFGFIDTTGLGHLSRTDQEINNIISAAKDANHAKEITVDCPTICQEPISEYSTTRIFARAFPWLFPGGVGDVKDYPGDMKEWAKMLNYYEDGRFTKDKFWCFFGMNYIIRHRNASSGRWFVNNFNSGAPPTLQDLQESVINGDNKFINNLTFYNKRIPGSTPYWNCKRSELFTWINHHVKMGRGAPMFFITLSCAEYYWPDLISLVKERMLISGDDSSQCYQGSPKLVQIMNQYSIVVQEYFQNRVKTWLDTVGKEILKINHYWVRYEFTPGRGQIHAHLLAISSDNSIYKLCHLDLKNAGEELRAQTLSSWAQETFGLVASVDENFDDITVSPQDNPISVKFKDLRSEKQVRQDGQALLKFCQNHECSNYCLKETVGKNK